MDVDRIPLATPFTVFLGKRRRTCPSASEPGMT
jgi:hypothetical protein